MEDLLAIKNLDERLALFDSLPESKRLFLLYPQMRTTGLPARDPYPENWHIMVTRANDVVKKKIQAKFPKQQQQAPAPPTYATNNDTVVHTDSGDSDDDSEDDGLYEKHVVRAMTHGNNNSTTTTTNNISQLVSSAERNQLLFLEHLPRCLPIITYGFHVDKHSRATKDDFCFCPCDRNTFGEGTVAGRWRALCRLDNILSEHICNTKKLIQIKPKPFLDHLKSKAPSCVFHEILYAFLDELFSQFNGLDDNNKHAKHNRHISFLDVNGPAFIAALVEIQKKEKFLERLAAEKMRRLEAEKHQLHQVRHRDSYNKNVVFDLLTTTCVSFSLSIY